MLGVAIRIPPDIQKNSCKSYDTLFVGSKASLIGGICSILAILNAFLLHFPLFYRSDKIVC